MYYYGKNTIKGLIESKAMFEVVYISENFNDQKYLNWLKQNKCYPVKISDSKIKNMVDNVNHQGIIAKAFNYQYYDFNKMISDDVNNNHSLIVILDGVEDPQNFGAIIRTSEAVGANGIVIGKNRSVKVTPTVAKVSTGAIENVKISQVTNIKNSLKQLKKEGYWVVAAHMDTDVLYDSIDYDSKIALVVGSEGKGISKIVLEECDFIVKIPMYGKVSSLNVSVSAAILMYQINSSRKK